MAAPVTDADIWWHALVGRELLQTGRTTDLGAAWAVRSPTGGWTSTQWLSEVLVAWSTDRVGWTVVPVAVVLAALALAVAVWLLAARRARPALAGPLTAVLTVPMVAFVQPRGATVGLLAACLLSAMAARSLLDGRPPSWLLAVLAFGWAQFHGTWVLVPLTLGALLACRLARAPVAGGIARHVGVLGLSLVAGTLSPAGPSGLLAGVVYRGAADHLEEWLPTTLTQPHVLPLAACAVVIVAAWAGTPGRVPAWELVWVLGWLAFGLLARRNIGLAAVMLLPVVAHRAQVCWGRAIRGRVPRPAAVVSLAVLVAVSALAGWEAATLDPLAHARGAGLAERLGRLDAERPLRVLNDYNAAGAIAYFAQAQPGGRVVLGIDGRAERYGPDYIDDYLGALQLRPGWQELVARIDPDVAVLERDAAIVHELRAHQGWDQIGEDGGYVLLQAPAGDPLPQE